MRVAIIAAALLGAATATTAGSPSMRHKADVESAVASRERSPDNVKLDSSRKPTALLRYLGFRRGIRVLDIVGGNLYWSEIEASAVGQKGHVTIWQPEQFLDDKGRKRLDAFAAAHANVSWLSSPFERPNLPANSFDFALINLDYHDVYWESAKFGIPRMNPDMWLSVLFAAMKPGATVGVIDHVARPGGDPRAVADRLHRIDPGIVRRDFLKAGFKLVGTSSILRNAADKHDLIVFDPAVRGKTDRFVMKFRKLPN